MINKIIFCKLKLSERLDIAKMNQFRFILKDIGKRYFLLKFLHPLTNDELHYVPFGPIISLFIFKSILSLYEIEYSGNAKYTAQEKEKIGIFSGKGGDNVN